MSDAGPNVAKAAVDLVFHAAAEAGLKLDVSALQAYAEQLAQLAVDLIDGHAKKHAAAAGETAAAKVTTMEEAEESAKKR